jgi:hypothetical protein
MIRSWAVAKRRGDHEVSKRIGEPKPLLKTFLKKLLKGGSARSVVSEQQCDSEMEKSEFAVTASKCDLTAVRYDAFERLK